MFTDNKFGLSDNLVEAVKAVMFGGKNKDDDNDAKKGNPFAKKDADDSDDKDDSDVEDDDKDAKKDADDSDDKDDPRKLKGGKTKVDLEPETDDDVTNGAEKKSKKKEVQESHNINHRELALKGLMHHSMAKHKSSAKGNDIDFYSTDNGNKIFGKVTVNDSKNVRVKDYASGKSHHFKISHAVDEEITLSDEEIERLNAISNEFEIGGLDEAKHSYNRIWVHGTGHRSHAVYGETHDNEVRKISGGHSQISALVKADQVGEKHGLTQANKDNWNWTKKGTNEDFDQIDEAKRGRPRKNPAPVGTSPEEEDEHEHVIMQLRKVVSTNGAKNVTHMDGKTTKMDPQLAQHFLNHHNKLKTAEEKQDFSTKLHKSHDSMRSAIV